ncbi:hypothetical protein C0J52_27212 [Blattella germanica]|nr:hypothetical protein C0J52_27212 [Blattella germanica]
MAESENASLGGIPERSLVKDIDEFLDVIVDEVECKVCLFYLAPPIKKCPNGHATCSSCVKKLSKPKCPICRSESFFSRDLGLERILDFTGVPCYYRDEGCKVRLRISEINEHILNCPTQQKKLKDTPQSVENFVSNIQDVMKMFNIFLKCTNCLEYMKPPISTCDRGHGVCKSCAKNWFKCASCDSMVLMIRNRCFENILNCTGVACYFSAHGCKERLRLEEIEEHVSKCPYRLRTCPFSKLKKFSCNWVGIDLENHISHSHPFVIVFSYNIPTLKVIINRNWDKFSCFIYTQGELFYYSAGKKSGKFHSTMYYLGDRNNTNDFRYEISFVQKDWIETVDKLKMKPSDYEFQKMTIRSVCSVEELSFEHKRYVIKNCFKKFVDVSPIMDKLFHKIRFTKSEST